MLSLIAVRGGTSWFFTIYMPLSVPVCVIHRGVVMKGTPSCQVLRYISSAEGQSVCTQRGSLHLGQLKALATHSCAIVAAIGENIRTHAVVTGIIRPICGWGLAPANRQFIGHSQAIIIDQATEDMSSLPFAIDITDQRSTG
jgi:hypothetical protein